MSSPQKTEIAGHAEADALAVQVASHMWPQDRAAHALGIRLVAVRSGYSLLAMEVREDMSNGHGTCHGGVIFTLADCAFAYACNSYNHPTVASAAHIDFLAPAMVGDQLEAKAQEMQRGGRTGLYDVTIRRGGKTVALFRGKSHRGNGEIVPGLAQPAGGKHP